MFRILLWVLLVLIVAGQQQNSGQAFPDNYSVYVRALQNGQNQATPSPYGAQPVGGYSPPLQPQVQPYRPPLIPQSGFQPLGAYGPPVPPQVQPPQQPQVRNFPQYQPPLSPPQFQPVQSASSLPHQQPNNNQQVIYVGGQQRQYAGQAPPTPAPAERPQSGGGNNQPVSFSTSYTSDAARHGKVVGSHQAAPAQVIQKAPASEIQFDKGAAAKDKDAANKNKKDDEYVIYYYYYYDDENKKQHKNLTLNFDDIPNLEQYDSPANKSAVGVARSVVANGVPNSLNGRPANEYAPTASPPRSATAVSVSVSVSEGPHQSPIPNSFRYGNSEIPRVALYKPSPPEPVRPTSAHLPPDGNAVSAASADAVRGAPTLSEAAITPPSPSAPAPADEVSESALEKPEDVNDVIDSKTKTEAKKAEVTEAELPTTTTTSEASTTEEATTTTESNRRPGFGNRRRFGPNGRATTRRPAISTTAATGTRRPVRPRPSRRPDTGRLRPTRPRTRTTAAPKVEEEVSEETDEETATNLPAASPSSTTAVPRRFGGTTTRSRYGNRNTAGTAPRSTSPAPSSASSAQPRTPRPRAGGVQRGSLFGRTRPPTGRAPGRRPPYLRNKPAVEEEDEASASKEEVAVSSQASTAESEETSSKATEGATSAAPATPAPSPPPSDEETSNQDSSSASEEDEPTEAPQASSTEANNKRNPLFRPRSRSPLFSAGNRPRSPLSRPRPQ